MGPAGCAHIGWYRMDVVDLRADGESADVSDYATCQMYGNEQIGCASPSRSTRIWTSTLMAAPQRPPG